MTEEEERRMSLAWFEATLNVKQQAYALADKAAAEGRELTAEEIDSIKALAAGVFERRH